ncbi:HNH endonuclease [Desulfoferrobacter suflitae]|uniref:HNH endonuclease n=1 Tax=Desulfoferrobacter suflitae TaxID=2865782 RepID=UPI0021649343|nr:HNH endonuclease [Desulfoferrobacter suflitae]MCK8602536.1 HNH endonuclease [Desulfoferrobacter suflitae]
MKAFQASFTVSLEPGTVEREKAKARAMRKTQWWRNQIAKGVCYYCGHSTPPQELTMDHIVPIIRGGRSTRGNLVPACKTCNSKKRYLLPLEWQEYLARL